MIPKKRGKWGTSEDAIILEGVRNGTDAEDILKLLEENDTDGRSRELETLKRRMRQLNIDDNKKENLSESEESLVQLRSKSFYPMLKKQYTKSELEYFESQWIDFMEQFKHNVLATEEMQVRQLINVDILITRGGIERKGHMEEGEKIDKLILEERAKSDEDQDRDLLSNWEIQAAQLKTSVSSFTTEYDKLLSQQKSISKDLKANRDARIQRIDDSKSSWAGTLKALATDDIGESQHAERMRLAQEKALEKLSELHEYEDGRVDQPFLNADTVIDDTDEITIFKEEYDHLIEYKKLYKALAKEN